MTASIRYHFRGTIVSKMVRGIVPTTRRPHRVVIHERMKIAAVFLFKASCRKIAVPQVSETIYTKFVECSYFRYKNMYLSYLSKMYWYSQPVFLLDKHLTVDLVTILFLFFNKSFPITAQKNVLHKSVQKVSSSRVQSRDCGYVTINLSIIIIKFLYREKWVSKNCISPVFLIRLGLLIHLRSFNSRWISVDKILISRFDIPHP